MKNTGQTEESRAFFPFFNFYPSPATCLLSTVCCMMASVFLFGDTWVQTTTSDFNTAGSATVETRVTNDSVELVKQADWWEPAANWPEAMSAWQYRKAITINNAGASALSDYQVKVENPVYDETGLVGSWHFEEGAGATSGSIADSSGYSNNGTMNGFSSPYGVLSPGKTDNSMSFDGSNDYVSIPHNNVFNFGAGDFSIEFWLKSDGTGTSERYIISKNTDGNNFWSFSNRISSTKLTFELYNGASSVALQSTTIFNDNVYRCFVVSRNAGVMKLYVNGVMESSGSFSGTMNFTGSIEMGRMGSLGNMKGDLDEVRIYNRALSIDEINACYNAKAKLNYGDIRFTGNSGMEFSYWMEKDGTFWVKCAGADSIPVGLTGVYMYYGNPLAASGGSYANNGANTFEFFEDYESYASGADLDAASKWSKTSNGSDFTLTAVDYIGSRRGRYLPSSTALSHIYSTEPTSNSWASDNVVVEFVHIPHFVTGENESIRVYTVNGSTWVMPLNDSWQYNNGSGWTILKSAAADTPVKIKFVMRSGSYDLWLDNSFFTGVPYAGASTTRSITFGDFQGRSEWHYTDNIFVRKYAATEPAVSFGSEIKQNDAFTRRKLVTVTAADALASGYSVKADVDIESLRSAGNLQSDIDDLRVIAYDRTGVAYYELDRDIVKGQGISLNGTSQFISVSDSSFFPQSSATIEFWFKASSIPASSYVTILSKGARGTDGAAEYEIMLDSAATLDVYRLKDDNVSAEADIATGIQVNQWYHFAVTYDGSSIVKVYLNGQFKTSWGKSNAIYNSTRSLFIGKQEYNAGTPGYYFDGTIDEVRISNNIRYTSNFVPQNTPFITDTNTTGLWHLDNDAGDASGNGNNGALNGSPYYTEGKVIAKGSSGMGRELSLTTTTGLLGLWHFNEGLGINAADSSGNSKNLTNNVSAWSSSGKFNASFNGNGSVYFANRADNLTVATSGTVEFWIKPNTGSSGGYIVTSASDSADQYYFNIGLSPTGQIYIQQYNNDVSNLVSGNTVLLTNGSIWYHVAVTSTGTTYNIYVNNQLQTLTGTNDGDWFGDTSNRTNFHVGVLKRTTYGSYFSGSIDEVAIYNRVLSASEIVEHYNARNELWFKTQSAINASSTSEATGTHSYYIYYNNASAGSPLENKYNVYAFYDGFDGASGWTYSENGVSFNGAQSTAIFCTPAKSYNINYPNSTSSLAGNYGRIGKAINFDGSQVKIIGRTYDDYTLGVSGYHIKRALMDSTVLWTDDVAGDEGGWMEFNVANTPTSGSHNINLEVYEQTGVGNFGINAYWDEIKIRKYTTNEPVLSLGTEDMPYNASGTFTSAVKDTGGNNTKIDFATWTATGAGTLAMEIRADDDNSGWTDFSPSWEAVTNGDMSVAVTGRYIQYRATFTGDGTSVEPVLTDITVTYTVPIIPPVDSVFCDKLTNNWYSTATFTFTNSVGFGAQINKYYYAWDNTASYTFNLTEPVWDSLAPQLLNSATSDGLWYFHYLPYSSTNTAGAAQDMGPFKYDGTAPPAMTLSLPLNNAFITESITDFSWNAVTDLSGVSYTLQLDNYTSFNSPVVNKINLSNPSYILSGTGAELLIGNSTYYWRVLAVDGASNVSNSSYYKFTTTSTIPQMINESTGEMYAIIQDAIDSASTTDGDTISIEDTIAHTENIVLTKDIVLENGILSPSSGYAVTGQGSTGNEILRNCVITSGGISNLALGENLTIFSPDSSAIVIENSRLINCLIGFGADISNSQLDNCDITATSDYFIGASTGDFRLKSTAVSAIDQGVNLSAEFNTDKDGNNKGVDILNVDNFDTGAWDLGAYEFIMTSGYTDVIVYVNPSGLVFSVQYGTPVTILTQAMTISKETSLDFEWTLQDDADWLAVTPGSGSGDPAVSVDVFVDISALPVGVYEATITLTSDTAINAPVEIPVSLVIYGFDTAEEELPSVPALNIPSDNAEDAETSIVLGWYASSGSGAIAYTVEYSSDYTFTSDVKINTGIETIYYTINDLAYGTAFYWRVKAVNDYGESNWSSVRSFTTKDFSSGVIAEQLPPGKPVLSKPLDNYVADTLPVVLQWYPSLGADVQYQIQISLEPDFSTVAINASGLSENAYELTDNSGNARYYWRVRASNADGTSSWTNIWTFKTAITSYYTAGTTSEPASETNNVNSQPDTGESAQVKGCFLKKIFYR
ncbi:MAG: DUF2341 domain-containing protein [Planctomycetes bacterium]|nr:DUF2341 domain-containing protein [Planctomycetota bacterium]